MIQRIRLTRPNVVVGGTLLVVFLVVMYAVAQFWSLRRGYNAEIENITPRMARLIGIAQSEDALQAAGADAAEIVSGVAYPADRDRAGTSAAMQQDVRELMMNAGLAISGSQIKQSRDGDGYERLRLDITVEGNVDAMEEAFAELEAMRPMVLIESMQVKPARRAVRSRPSARDQRRPEVRGDPRMLSATLELFSLRLKQ